MKKVEFIFELVVQVYTIFKTGQICSTSFMPVRSIKKGLGNPLPPHFSFEI